MANETRFIEYKQTITNEFLKTVSAFANYGTGDIIFGVSNTGEHVPIDNLEEMRLNIENKINDSISPIPNYQFEELGETGPLKLTVYKGESTPYRYKGKAYRRADTADVEAGVIETNRLTLEGMHRSYDSTPATTQDLTFELLTEKLKTELALNEVSPDIFRSLSLLDPTHGYNKAAELLADTNTYPGLTMVRFGKSISQILDDVRIEHISLLEEYKKAVDVYRRYYQYEVIEGAYRETVSTIPEVAFREAVANALVHRTWDVHAAVRISMFEDHIEITSPGGLPTGLTETEYWDGLISILRNPILADIFHRLHIIDQIGTGILRIKEAYQAYHVKPTYKVTENTITLILPVVNVDQHLNETESRVYQLLVQKQSAARPELEMELSLSKDTCIRALNSLIEKNLISKTGSGRATRYIV